MSYTVTQDSFAKVASYWRSSDNHLNWGSVFVLPAWLEVWWREFQPGSELYLGTVRQDVNIIGMAPLQVKGAEASFIGSIDVCDYMDFVIAPGRENDFFKVLLGDLGRKGISRLDLKDVRPDSTVLTHLVDMARNLGYEVSCRLDAISLEMDLPASWDDYLMTLSGKQRHELKRKMRRLMEENNIDFRVARDTGGYLDSFLNLFALSREEKAGFMTARMESFFRSMAEAMAGLGMLRIGIVKLSGLTIAATMSFDYDGKLYLYNSAFDPSYGYLSVGILSKALGIKDSIQSGIQKWDFLKGEEIYKSHLGGKKIPLYSCQITSR